MKNLQLPNIMINCWVRKVWGVDGDINMLCKDGLRAWAEELEVCVIGLDLGAITRWETLSLVFALCFNLSFWLGSTSFFGTLS